MCVVVLAISSTLVQPDRLLEALAFARRCAVPPPQEPFGLQDSVEAGGADSHQVGVHHHVGEPAIALAHIAVSAGDDGGLFLAFQPEVSRNPGAVLVHHAAASAPLVALAPADAEPLGDLVDAYPTHDEMAGQGLPQGVEGEVRQPAPADDEPPKLVVKVRRTPELPAFRVREAPAAFLSQRQQYLPQLPVQRNGAELAVLQRQARFAADGNEVAIGVDLFPRQEAEFAVGQARVIGGRDEGRLPRAG